MNYDLLIYIKMLGLNDLKCCNTFDFSIKRLNPFELIEELIVGKILIDCLVMLKGAFKG
jgi:hypothetical protein